MDLRKLGSDVLRTDYVYFGASGNFRLQQLKTGTPSNPTSLQDLRYTYDAVGNVLTIKDYKAGSPQTQSFSYDHLDRLLSASVTGGSGGAYTASYTYNEIGNITSWDDGTYVGYYYESGKPHAVTTVGVPPWYIKGSYSYDANGNMTGRTVSGTSYTLTYDAENRLTQVSGRASASFEYDGDGQQVKATFDSSTTVYIGDYYEQTGSTVRKYYYAGGRRIAMRENSTLYWLLTDHLGSTAITANSGGSRVAELRYKAWGETRYTDGTTPTSYRFTGQRLDESTGLYYYGARFYDPVLGRFVQADTIVPEPGNPQALNRYSYVLNNPLKYTDPDGHCPFGILGCLVQLAAYYEVGNFAAQLKTWHNPLRALAASSESSFLLRPLTIEASKLVTAPYERDIQQVASAKNIPTDILRGAIRLQALGSGMDPVSTRLAQPSGQELQDVSVGIGQITLREAQKFRNLGLIDFDPTSQNIQDPHHSIQLMAAKLQTVDMRILEYIFSQGFDQSMVGEADRRMLLMIGQNEGAGIVDLYFKYGGNWELILQDNPWARFHLEAMQRRMAE